MLTYEPKGIRFTNARTGQEMLLNVERTGWRGWLFFRHCGGQWVSLRQASQADLLTILEQFAAGPAPRIISAAESGGEGLEALLLSGSANSARD
jgi:hypothetical protein